MISKHEAKRLPYDLTVLDLGAVLLAFSLSLYLRFSTEVIPLSISQPNVPKYLYLIIGLLPVWWLNLAYFKLYNPNYLLYGNEEYSRIVNAGTTATVHTAVIIYLLRIDFARGWVLLSWVTAIIFLMIGRFLHRRLHKIIVHGSGRKISLVIVGANEEAKTLVDEIDGSDLGIQIEGAVSWPMREPAKGLKIIGELDNLTKIIEEKGIEAVIVVPSALPAVALQGLYGELARYGVKVFISPSLSDIISSRAVVLPINDIPLISISNVEFSGIKYFLKRSADIVGSFVLLVLLSPIFIAIALLIHQGSKGPSFFRQARVGRRESKFMVYKFRTMVANAESQKKDLFHLNEVSGPIFKIKLDPRITKIGKWLRHYSLDELPQLFNVLKGEMSLVGPRPPLPAEVEAYNDWERRRLEVSPGMTGLWQVRGRSDTTFEEMVRLDLYYIENWSPILDFYILFRTIGVVFSGKGAY